jgi:hypothetical protein
VLQRSKTEGVIGELTLLSKAQNDMPKYAAGDRKPGIEGGGNLFRAAHVSGVRRYLTTVDRIPLECSGRKTDG